MEPTVSTARTRSRDPAATRTSILEAAERLFAEKGFAATSMRDLAEASGASKALIHHHFGSKEELYAAVKKRVVDRYLEAQRPQLKISDDPPKFLVEATRTAFLFCRDNPQVARLAAWAQLEEDPAPWPGVEELRPLVFERIGEAQDAGVLRKDLHPAILVTALGAMVTQWWQFKEANAGRFLDYPNPETLDDDYFQEVMEVFLHGAAGRRFPKSCLEPLHDRCEKNKD